MTTNLQSQSDPNSDTLHMALELSASTWTLGFADRLGRKARVRTIDAACNPTRLWSVSTKRGGMPFARAKQGSDPVFGFHELCDDVLHVSSKSFGLRDGFFAATD